MLFANLHRDKFHGSNFGLVGILVESSFMCIPIKMQFSGIPAADFTRRVSRVLLCIAVDDVRNSFDVIAVLLDWHHKREVSRPSFRE
jgi:hypothetical protein